MEFQGRHSEHDALDEILRRYLLENNPSGPDGESLMELAGESVLAEPPLVTPPPAREAEMLEQLKQAFPDTPVPGPTGGLSLPLKGLIGVGALAVLTSAILLIFNPFGDNASSKVPDALKHMASDNVRTLSQDAPIASLEDDFGDAEDISSLQQGDGNPFFLDIQEEIGTGTGDRNLATGKAWKPGSNLHLPDQTRSDPPTTAPFNSGTAHSGSISRPPLDPFPLRGLFAQTTVQSKYYQLEPGKDHLIAGKKGTLLHIPRNAFVDAQSGEAVEEVVQVEFKEIYKRSDYLKSNLPTISNNRQLVSGGVVFVDATAAGRRLKLAKGKDIYIEFANQPKVDTRDMQLYTGEFNEKGEMNWLPVGGQFKNMIPLPAERLYLDEYRCDCDGERYWNRLIHELMDEHYGNTYLVTREFRERVRVLSGIGYYELGLLMYRDNTDKPLWKVDEMVAELLKDEVKKGNVKEKYVDAFNNFAQEMHASVEPYDDRGVDLGRWDARRQLMYRSVSRTETERLIRLHRLREQFVQEIESGLTFGRYGGQKYVVGKRKRREAGTAKGFLIEELGWTNLDKVVDKQIVKGKTRDLKVRLTGDIKAYESTSSFLVYKEINSMITADRFTGQYFKFRNVPTNVDAWIVTIGYRNAMPYIGMTRLPKGRVKEVWIDMKRSTVDGYLAALQELD